MRHRINRFCLQEQGAGLSGGSLFSGLRISSSTSSQSPTVARAADSDSRLEHRAVEDETVTGGETGFSFVSQSRDKPDVEEFDVASPLEKLDSESHHASCKKSSTS